MTDMRKPAVLAGLERSMTLALTSTRTFGNGGSVLPCYQPMG